jgi:hypothetical protein
VLSDISFRPVHITLSLRCGEQKDRIRRVNSRNTIIAIIATLSASLAFTDDFKTINGKEYKNVTVSRVEADGIVIKGKSGISKVYFTELPKDVQQRFGYDADRAREYAAEQNKGLEEAQRQQVEQMRQSEQERLKKNIEFGKAQNAIQQWENAQSLQDALMVLQQKKAALEQRIRDRRSQPAYLRSEVGYRVYYYANPARRDLPDLEDRLSELNRTIEQTEKQLRQSQQTQH